MEPFSQNLIGFQHDHEGFVIDFFDCLFHQIHFLIIAGTHNHLLILLPVTSARMMNGRSSPCPFIYDLCDFFSLLCKDQSQFSGIDALHGFIYYQRQQGIDDDSINDTIHILEDHATKKHDQKIQCKHDLSQRQMRLHSLQ